MVFEPSMTKASLAGAFFIAWLSTISTAVIADCAIDRPEQLTSATVRSVYDGDTLTLTDGRRVRLIGVNTPEMNQGRNPQALAIEARNHLRKLLFMAQNRVLLKVGKDTHDRHERLLAHLYLQDGRSLAEELVKKGYGWVVAVGENTSAAACLKLAENLARNNKKGVWSRPKFQATAAKNLKLRMRGFKLIHGRVTRVNESLKAIWLHLDNKLSLRISKSALQYFPVKPSSQWIGTLLEARGWLYASKGKLSMNIYHPATLQQIDATATKE